MDQRNPVVDKILEALTPALSGEVERTLAETRQQQEQEFGRRLETAVREAENAATQQANAQAAAQREQEISGVREEARKQVAELQAQFGETLQRTTNEMQAKFDKRTQAAEAEWNTTRTQMLDEKTRLQTELERWRTFVDAQRQMDNSGSQAEILTRFLNFAEPFASAVAVYVNRADGLALWKARGKAAFPEAVSQDTSDPESYFRPVVIRERSIAAVSALQPFDAEALDFLVASLNRAIEAFGMKLKTPPPRSPGSAVAAAAAAPGSVSSSAAAAPAAPDDKVSAEARLAARLLVSEIKLYNEQDVREGRLQFNLYSRLRKQIEQSREQYRQRVDGGILAARDFFHEELVRVLADGEASRLGSDYPGPSRS